jgi:hypothetical protein
MPLEAPLAVRLNFGNLLPKGKDIKIDTTVYQKDSKGTTLGCFLQAVPKNCYAIIRHLSDTSEERPEEKLILTATSSFGSPFHPSMLRFRHRCLLLPSMPNGNWAKMFRHLETCWDMLRHMFQQRDGTRLHCEQGTVGSMRFIMALICFIGPHS